MIGYSDQSKPKVTATILFDFLIVHSFFLGAKVQDVVVQVERIR